MPVVPRRRDDVRRQLLLLLGEHRARAVGTAGDRVDVREIDVRPLERGQAPERIARERGVETLHRARPLAAIPGVVERDRHLAREQRAREAALRGRIGAASLCRAGLDELAARPRDPLEQPLGLRLQRRVPLSSSRGPARRTRPPCRTARRPSRRPPAAPAPSDCPARAPRASRSRVPLPRSVPSRRARVTRFTYASVFAESAATARRAYTTAFASSPCDRRISDALLSAA